MKAAREDKYPDLPLPEGMWWIQDAIDRSTHVWSISAKKKLSTGKILDVLLAYPQRLVTETDAMPSWYAVCRVNGELIKTKCASKKEAQAVVYQSVLTGVCSK